MFPEDPDDTVWICMCPDEAVVAADSPDIECNDPPPRISLLPPKIATLPPLSLAFPPRTVIGPPLASKLLKSGSPELIPPVRTKFPPVPDFVFVLDPAMN